MVTGPGTGGRILGSALSIVVPPQQQRIQTLGPVEPGGGPCVALSPGPKDGSSDGELAEGEEALLSCLTSVLKLTPEQLE